jgi:hypothetical protein
MKTKSLHGAVPKLRGTACNTVISGSTPLGASIIPLESVAFEWESMNHSPLVPLLGDCAT